MTERLYYTDPYRTRFTAQVSETLTWPGPEDRPHPAVVLDRTAFYPESGGQPADRGTLGNATVLDVVEREADGLGPKPIVHVLSDAVGTGEVVGRVDWQRRFDHMQQHTGQHILSAAFEQLLDAATVGFHLGATSSTIDVDLPDLQLEDVLGMASIPRMACIPGMTSIPSVEAAANGVVWDDRPISTRFVSRAPAADLPVAGLSIADLPSDVEGPIRLIVIPGPPADVAARKPAHLQTGPPPHFDVNPCGGTHVARTGEIGMIKIVGLEHRGDETRIEFLCGERALRDYEAMRSITTALAKRLTVGTGELDEAVERLREENKQLRRAERELQRRLLDMESAELVGTAAIQGPYRVVGAVWRQRSPDELRTLARKLAERSDVVALLFSVPAASSPNPNERTHFCFARAENLDLDVNQLLQEACAQLDGKGGGRPQVAQGSAPGTGMDQVKGVLRGLELALERV